MLSVHQVLVSGVLGKVAGHSGDPDMDNGSMGCVDGIGYAAERVFGKGRSPAILSAKPGKLAELLLNFRLQMILCGCN